MTYLAITQGTAEWMIAKPGVLDALNRALMSGGDILDPLVEYELAEGPFRMSADANRLVALWNVDYLTGTDEESWGFVKLSGEFGILSKPGVCREVMERCLYVINQRLQSLFIEGAFIHRAYPNGTHTCLAGRGSVARKFTIGYFEQQVVTVSSTLHSVVCVGPEVDFARLSTAAALSGQRLEGLTTRANALIDARRKKPVGGSDLLADLRLFLSPFLWHDDGSYGGEYGDVEVATDGAAIESQDAYRAVGLTYTNWLHPDSSLSDVQRRIVESDAIERHPLRIVGPGGSGKTLLLQLLAMRRLTVARDNDSRIRVLYLVHNAAMAGTVRHRFGVLGLSDDGSDAKQWIDVTTLTDYARIQLGLEEYAVIDPDARGAKEFQLEVVVEALEALLEAGSSEVENSELFRVVRDTRELAPVLAMLIVSEISTAIKGHGLERDQKRYVQAERRLSRLHGLLEQRERALVFDIFERYHQVVFEQYGVLDTDDIALSLLGRLRTPIWALKRRRAGYDYVFVDETQLFNENERRLIPLLTNGLRTHVPVVLALDEAQDVFARSTAGMATLGIPNIFNESLASIHRSTRAIVRLAFYVIQRSTDLFSVDFPDFTGIAEHMEPDNHPLAARPRVDGAVEGSGGVGRFVVRRIRELRKKNLREIAVVCHSDPHYEALARELRATDLPLHELVTRGEKLDEGRPLVALTRPAYVGGQEFDAVILVGLEQGVVPPRVVGNEALAVAIEQATVRELYVSITRARYQVLVVLSVGTTLTSILQDAVTDGFLEGLSRS